jgi:hypothetical protein
MALQNLPKFGFLVRKIPSGNSGFRSRHRQGPRTPSPTDGRQPRHLHPQSPTSASPKRRHGFEEPLHARRPSVSPKRRHGLEDPAHGGRRSPSPGKRRGHGFEDARRPYASPTPPPRYLSPTNGAEQVTILPTVIFADN